MNKRVIFRKTNRVFCSNFIQTSKYTPLNFIPKTLMQQFRQYANIYFLIICILQSTPSISPLNPVTAIAPLILVLGVSIVREGYEDLYRRKSDRVVNNEKQQVIRQLNRMSVKMIQQTVDDNYIKIQKGCDEQQQQYDGLIVDNIRWKDIRVGDIVILHRDQDVPADLMVISSHYKSGLVYIQTSSLDGEKGLKTRYQIEVIQNMLTTDIELQYQQPNQYLHQFQGVIKYNEAMASSRTIINTQQNVEVQNTNNQIVEVKHFLPRGSKLKNTKFILGLVLYTGNDTKLMMNSEDKKHKQSKLSQLINKFILYIFVFQIISCIVMSLFYMNSQNLHYFRQDDNTDLLAFQTFWGYLLLLNTMIPISLMVSLEMIRVCQVFFVSRDFKFDKCTYQTSSINEELGQIQTIFTDKTGTLTQNIMEFRHFVFSQDQFSFPVHNNNQSNKLKNQLESLKSQLENSYEIDQLDHKNKQLYILLLTLSLCHDCVLNQDNDDDQQQQVNGHKHNDDDQQQSESKSIEYTGQSPDEITLLQAAYEMGFKYLGVKSGLVILDIFRIERKFEILYNFEFDSDRKRSSVIIRDIEIGWILVLVKGADNMIKDIIDLPEPTLQTMDNHLDIFSKQGLRTLCYGFKRIESSELEQFDKQYNSLYSNQQKTELQKLILEIESGIKLLACTAIEDKLQENVENVIQDILNANIKIWMLTGDKLETAENIGKSCGLIGVGFQIIRIRQRTRTSIIDKFREIHQINQLCEQINKKTCLVIDGECLQLIMEDNNLSQIFNKLSCKSDSIIVCRCTPLQKAFIIKQSKKFNNQVTLAIGDGANDVNMIQAADIGIGIYGNEGLRASQSSDFAIGQFQDLRDLLFQHGRQFYIRISNTILYFFYKNFIFTLPQIFYAFSCSYSAQPFFDEWYISLYNMCFTSWPLLIYAIFDNDIQYIRVQNGKVIKDHVLYQLMPYLYYQSNSNLIFNYNNFIMNLIVASVQAILIYQINLITFSDQIVNLQLQPFNSDLWSFSVSTFSSIYLVVTIRIVLMIQNINWISLTGIFPLSILVFICYFIISTYIPIGHVQNVPVNLVTSPQFWIQLLFCSLLAFIFELVIIIYSNRLHNINYIVRQYISSQSNQQKYQLQSRILQFIKDHQKYSVLRIKSCFRNQKNTPSYNHIESQVFNISQENKKSQVFNHSSQYQHQQQSDQILQNDSQYLKDQIIQQALQVRSK